MNQGAGREGIRTKVKLYTRLYLTVTCHCLLSVCLSVCCHLAIFI